MCQAKSDILPTNGTVTTLHKSASKRNCEKMSQCSRFCLSTSMCNTGKNYYPICHLRMCEFNFPPYREQRRHVKSFIRPVAQRLGKDFFPLRDKIKSQFDQYMFWGNYAFKWLIDEVTLQPVWRKGACKPLIQLRCR